MACRDCVALDDVKEVGMQVQENKVPAPPPQAQQSAAREMTIDEMRQVSGGYYGRGAYGIQGEPSTSPTHASP